MHPNNFGWERVGYQKGMCPVAEEICLHIINLPTHSKINKKEIERIIKFLERHYKAR